MGNESSFYDDHYYKTHYGKIFETDYYERISAFWKYVIFDCNKISVNSESKLLDYGAGLGQISAAFGADCFDPSPVALQFLKAKGRKVYEDTAEIPSGHYNYLLSSHALEHALNPTRELNEFKRILTETGCLILILPAENIPGTPVKLQDDNKHFYCWNFQTVANLLIESGFEIEEQKMLYGPTGLSFTKNMALVKLLGELKRNYSSILTVARVKQKYEII